MSLYQSRVCFLSNGSDFCRHNMVQGFKQPSDATLTDDLFDEVVIVPDGPLWYVPFEMLPMGENDSPLIGDRIRIRYAATPGLAFHPTGSKATNRAIGIAGGKFFAPRDPEVNETIIQSIAEAVDQPVRLPEQLDLPSSLLGGRVGHLLVTTPIAPNLKQPLATNVGGYDQSTPAGSLLSWTQFPAKVPASVILPGYRSTADIGQIGDGNEVFMTVCALQSAGVRSVLLSRWIVGGQSTAIALREFVQELPFTGMLKSWDRAKKILRQTELDPMAEPLLTQAEHDREGLTGDQPFFWAGYLIAAPFDPSELQAGGPSQ